MGQGRFGIAAEVLPALDRRVKTFTKHIIERSIQRMPLASAEIVELARLAGLVKVIHCTDENIEQWEHLPVELGDDIYQLIEELD
jgi:hypothetical protein